MAVRDVFKVTRKTFVNPSGWIDYQFLKGQTVELITVLKGLFTPATPTREESFTDAMKRLGMTEADVASAISYYRLLALVFLLITLLIFFYSFYLLFSHHTFLGWMLGMAVSALLAVQAFKYDFWAFQMRRRKLGATFDEWKNNLLGGKGPEA